MITIDFETFYGRGYSLTKLTTEEYINHSDFEIIGVAVKQNDQETEWFSNEYLDHQKTRYKDVVCATSAAPTFFSDYSFNGLNYVDGGVTTNNPSYSILTHARLQQGRDMRKTILVSVGTGIVA